MNVVLATYVFLKLMNDSFEHPKPSVKVLHLSIRIGLREQLSKNRRLLEFKVRPPGIPGSSGSKSTNKLNRLSRTGFLVKATITI